MTPTPSDPQLRQLRRARTLDDARRGCLVQRATNEFGLRVQILNAKGCCYLHQLQPQGRHGPHISYHATKREARHVLIAMMLDLEDGRDSWLQYGAPGPVKTSWRRLRGERADKGWAR
jgi:hypothetical protein